MLISRAHAIKLNTTCLELCCIYAVYLTLIKVLVTPVFSFALLVPAYFTAACLHKSGRKVLGPRTLQYLGICTGLAYAVVLLGLVIQHPPWHWLSVAGQMNFNSPLQIVISHFDAITITATGLLLWGMGWRQAMKNMDFSGMFFEFQIGFGILFLVLIMTHELNVEITALPLIIGLFFTFGLYGLVLCRENPNLTHRNRPSQAHTIYALMGIVFIFITAGIFMLLASQEVAGKILYLCQLSRQWLWSMILGLMDFFLNLFPSRDALTLPGDYRETTKVALNQVIKDTASSSKNIREIFHIVYALFWAGVVLSTLWRLSALAINFLKKQSTAADHISYHSMPGAFKNDLFKWMKKAIKQITTLFNKFIPLALLFPSAFPKKPLPQKIYEQMLKWSSKKGVKRHLNQTPDEHGRCIGNRTPENTDTIKTITRFYEKHRYGDIPLTPQEELNLTHAWHHLKKRRTLI